MNIDGFDRWLLIVFLFINPLSAHSAPVPKPGVPLQVTIQPVESTDEAGQATDFRVSVMSYIASDNLLITVQPPNGTQLNSGALIWRGPVQARQPIELEFNVTVPAQSAAVIRVTAAIEGQAGGRYAAHDAYALQPGINQRIKPDQLRRIQRNGRQIVEHPLHPSKPD